MISRQTALKQICCVDCSLSSANHVLWWSGGWKRNRQDWIFSTSSFSVAMINFLDKLIVSSQHRVKDKSLSSAEASTGRGSKAVQIVAKFFFSWFFVHYSNHLCPCVAVLVGMGAWHKTKTRGICRNEASDVSEMAFIFNNTRAQQLKVYIYKNLSWRFWSGHWVKLAQNQ